MSTTPRNTPAAAPVLFLLSLLIVSTPPRALSATNDVSPTPPALARLHRPDPSTWSRTKCGHPAGGADIPSRWASDVDPAAREVPLELYPRPQMVRCGVSSGAVNSCLPRSGAGPDDTGLNPLRDTGDESTWQNLNGLWEWEATTERDSDWNGADPPPPPFGRTLNASILVPFPVESCLSGVAPTRSADLVRSMWYRLEFESVPPDDAISGRMLLHFGAVDWSTHVYLNGRHMGHHAGGYDGFSFDITAALLQSPREAGAGGTTNELLVHVYDPSDAGAQPNGKQSAATIDACRGVTYTPSSGIWQTVWLEWVPRMYVTKVTIDQASAERVAVTVSVAGLTAPAPIGLVVYVDVLDGPAVVASKEGLPGEVVSVPVPNAKLWSPSRPFLYDLRVTLLLRNGEGNMALRADGSDARTVDEVVSYFGLRTFETAPSAAAVNSSALRPTLNGRPVFLAGVLDQSFWPDGLYTAPTDDALAFDVQLVPNLGMNLIRLHQKVNPERWYYHADRLGVVVFQDMPQKYGGATNATVPFFVDDMTAAVTGRGNHPSIVQWTVFNEGDCWRVFNEKPYDVAGMVDLVRTLDPTPRLVDTDSGGGANDLHVGDVNDVHTYPFPGDPHPSRTQYAMIGEYGGLGVFVEGAEWKPGGCWAYRQVGSSEEYALLLAGMAGLLEGRADRVGAAVYTQTTDVECECDGLVNYDRSAKFSDEEAALIRRANERLTTRPVGGLWDHTFDATIA